MADEPDLKYPLAPTDEWYGEANYKTTGGNLVEMTPEDFLSRVRPLDMDEISRENIGFLKEHIVSGRLLDPLQIYRNGSEDGRHRAHAAKEMGIKKIPVITWTEPRPPDQSNLPAVIDAAAAASRLALPPDDEPRPKGKAFGSGIGSLMRRRMFPLIQAVQQGYEHLLTEEQKNDLREFLAQPTHEFFGFEESGLESLKEKLGILPDDMPGETSLSVIEGRKEKPPDTGMADGGLVDNLSNVSFDINDPFANPEEYEEANPYSLGVLGLAASIAAGPFSPIVWGIRGLQAYNFAKSQGWLGEEEPQYTGPVNPQTHEIDVINVTEEEANPQFSQAQVSLAPAQGAESELGNPPPDPTVDPTFGSMGTPPSGSDGAGDGTGEGAASAAADSPAGSPWNTGGFVVKPLYDS